MFLIPIAGIGYVRVDASEPRRIDGLCPTCLSPSLLELDALTLSPDGVTVIATVTICTDHA